MITAPDGHTPSGTYIPTHCIAGRDQIFPLGVVHDRLQVSTPVPRHTPTSGTATTVSVAAPTKHVQVRRTLSTATTAKRSPLFEAQAHEPNTGSTAPTAASDWDHSDAWRTDSLVQHTPHESHIPAVQATLPPTTRDVTPSSTLHLRRVSKVRKRDRLSACHGCRVLWIRTVSRIS